MFDIQIKAVFSNLQTRFSMFACMGCSKIRFLMPVVTRGLVLGLAVFALGLANSSSLHGQSALKTDISKAEITEEPPAARKAAAPVFDSRSIFVSCSRDSTRK